MGILRKFRPVRSTDQVVDLAATFAEHDDAAVRRPSWGIHQDSSRLDPFTRTIRAHHADSEATTALTRERDETPRGDHTGVE